MVAKIWVERLTALSALRASVCHIIFVVLVYFLKYYLQTLFKFSTSIKLFLVSRRTLVSKLSSGKGKKSLIYFLIFGFEKIRPYSKLT